MRVAIFLPGCLPLLFVAVCAHASSVYRCAGVDGAPAYQDQPCRSGEKQVVVPLREASPAAFIKASPPPSDDALAADDMASATAPVAHIAPPSFFLCARYDGSRYLSDDGIGGRNAVPLGMLGVPERSLAQAYGGRNGIGVSAPGLRPIPQIPFAQAPLAGSYVWIDDECHHAQTAEACAYLRSELDTLESKLRRAFSDTAPALKTQAQDVRERLRGC